MIPVIDPCENKKVTIEVSDNVTTSYIQSALINVVANSTIIAENVHTDEDGKLDGVVDVCENFSQIRIFNNSVQRRDERLFVEILVVQILNI